MSIKAGLLGILLCACGGGGRSFDADGGSDATAGMDSNLGFGDSSSEGGPCSGLACQVTNCGGGVSTTISGTVYAPNGTLPLYNIIVYVPNTALDPIKHGVSCDQCGTIASGNPITVALTDSKGHFQIQNAPDGANIPLVMQVGKWRREITIPAIKSCTDNPVGQNVGGVEQLTRLPRNLQEGDMPYVAVTTGGCEHFACMLPKLGIDTKELAGGPTSSTAKITTAFNFYAGQFQLSSQPSSWPAASNLWNNSALLDNFDMAMFSCECEEPPDANQTSYDAVLSYLNAGGRVFGTDYMYVWYKFSKDTDLNASPWQWPGGAPGGTDPILIDTTFPKGQSLADWLYYVSGINPYNGWTQQPPTKGQFPVFSAGGAVWANIDAINTKYGLEWTHSGGHPNIVTMNMPSAQPPAMQCGKGVHLDIHVEQNNDMVDTTYPAGCSSQLHEPDLVTIFFFYDIASCIQDDKTMPPVPH